MFPYAASDADDAEAIVPWTQYRPDRPELPGFFYELKPFRAAPNRIDREVRRGAYEKRYCQ
jgi:hypothetical protein